MFSLKYYIGNYKKYVIIGPCFKFLETMTDVFTPYIVAKILDVGVVNNDTKYIYTMALIALLINILGFVFALICQKCSAITSEGVGRDIRRDIFQHVNTFSHAELDKFSTMSLTNRMINDTEQICTAISMTIRQLARAPFLLIGCFIITVTIDWKLSLIFLAVSPVILLITLYVMKKTAPLHLKTKQDLDSLSSVARDNLSGVRVIRAFDKQNDEIVRFDRANNEMTGTLLKVGEIAARMPSIMMLVINFAIIGIIWLGGVRVNIGRLTSGQVIAFINYCTSIASAMLAISRVIIVYTRTGASIKRIKEIFETQNSISSPARPIALNLENGAEIEFKNVSFSFSDAKDVVKNLSIKAAPGETIGIIGGTGSGKSSVVNLIPRFYDPTKGKVILNGKDLRRYDVQALRERIGIVPQNPTLFKGTIRDNMRWHKSDATDDEIIRALIIAQAYEFVKAMPDFLDSKVERGGTNFSGGQRQRLTIARALVNNPAILILDDSSSALDFATDAALRRSISKYMSNVTTFIVAQRATALASADKIIVLDNGNVVGIGTHDELMQNCQVYQEIYTSQNRPEGARQ